MKIIFLDFDGVLNCDPYFRSYEFQEETHGQSDAQIMLVSHWAHIDPNRVKLMNRLVDETGALVVASTTWRLRYSLEELNEALKSRGATFEITDKTPRLSSGWGGEAPRHFEIQTYLDNLKEKPEAFVIIDDIKDMGPLNNHLALTNFMGDGFNPEVLDKAFNILDNKL